MPKTKEGEGATTDWSSTGTFLRKPQTGWLHDDRELRDGSAINYQVKVRLLLLLRTVTCSFTFCFDTVPGLC